MNEKELRRELRRVRHRETELLARSRYGKGISLETILNKYLPEKLEQTLDSAFREAFRMIFSKGTSFIGKTFNEKKLRESEGDAAEAQKRWMTDVLLTGVEGTGLGLMGVGLPDIPVFTGMLLRAVYQSASSYGFKYDTKTEQYFILCLMEAALTRGKKAEELSGGLDDLMHRIDVEGFDYYGSLNQQIERTSKALSDETLYLKFVQTLPVVGVAGGLSNPIYMNKIKNYAEVKYKKRRLLIQLREAKAASAKAGPAREQETAGNAAAETHNAEPAAAAETRNAEPNTAAEEPSNTEPAAAAEPERLLNISVYDPEEE